MGGGVNGPGRYYFLDQTVTNDVTYTYLVEDIDMGGPATLHGPVSATPTAAAGPAAPLGPYDNSQTNDGSAGFPTGAASNPDASATSEYLPTTAGARITQTSLSGFDIEIDVPRFLRGGVVAGRP